MKSLIFLLSLLSCNPCLADTKIGDLPLGSASATGVNDSFPYVQTSGNTTKRLKLSDLINLPSLQSEFLTLVPSQFGQNGKVLKSNGTNTFWGSGATVSSVGLSDGSAAPIYSISGSPVTSSGTLSFTLNTQTANKVFAGPTTGSAAEPSFRSLVGADLPNPSSSSLGGVQSYVAVTSQWIDSISTLGVPHSSQPACGDLSNGAASCSTDTTNASNISSGTLPAARLPTPTAVTLGGVESIAAVTHNFLTSISTSGVPAQAQPACSDLSNAAASCSTDATNASNISSGTLPAARLPNPSATTLGGIESYASVSNQWINAISTSGVPSSSQPAFTNISGTAVETQGGTNQTTYATGDTLYASAANTLSKLSGNITATKKYLSQTGNGSISAAPSWLQPACGDLSNAATSCSTDTTNASNISSGTLPAARLPNPSATTLGGIESYAAVSNQWINAISTSGVPSSTQPAFTNISGTAVETQGGTNQTTYATGDTLYASAANTLSKLTGNITTTKKYLSQTGSGAASAAPSWLQPACGDLSNAAASCSTDTTVATNITTGTLGSTVQGNITTVGTISSGTWSGTTIAVNKGGTGQTSYTDGQLLIGNSSGNTLTKATLSAGAGIAITNGNGSISIATSGTSAPGYTYVSQSSTLNPAAIGDYYLLSGASFTITLPTAASIAGQLVAFQHNGTSVTQVYTFNTTSSQTINGPGGTVASGSYALYTNGETLVLLSDGANWQVAQHVTESAVTTATNTLNNVVGAGCTGTPAAGTHTDNTWWHRRGKYAIYHFGFDQTATGTSGSSCIYGWVLPLTADTTNMVLIAAPTQGTQYLGKGFGVCSFSGNGEGARTGQMLMKDSTHFFIQSGIAGSSNNWGSGSGSFGGNTTLDASCDVEIPISGWQP